MVQLAERLLLTQEDPGSNPVTDNFYLLRRRREKEAQNGPLGLKETGEDLKLSRAVRNFVTSG